MKNTVVAVASLAAIFCETQAEKNAWKKRMVLAGYDKRGVSFPDDWNSLSEDEKERRLDLALEQLAEIND
jgi:hypothetical protein